MLARTLRTFTFALSLPVLAASSTAQQTLADTLRTEPPTSIQFWRYDLATRSLAELLEPPGGFSLSREAVTCFDNDFSTAARNSSHPEVVQEMVDWGTKACGASGLVNAFTFGYRTDLPDASMSVAFYLGTTGFGELGTLVRRFDFTAMPGGFNVVHVITVDVSSEPLVLPDGDIGWSYTNEPFDAFFGNAGTLLSPAPNAALGIEDALDVYTDPPATTGTYTGTFNFGAGSNVGSIFMQIEEDDGSLTASTFSENGSGINPLALIPLTPPRIDSRWQTVVDTTTRPDMVATALAMATGPAASPRVLPMGELLIDVSNPVHVVFSTGLHSVQVPTDLTLVGVSFAAQGAILGPAGITLTNRLDITLGF